MTTCLALIGLIACLCRDAHAQGAVGGVYIDAEGMLRQTASLTQGDRLQIARTMAAEGAASADVAAASPLRKISLRRLEQTVSDLYAAATSIDNSAKDSPAKSTGKPAASVANKPLPADIRYLAGLYAVQYVFFYPETGDVVLAGPAEGWKQLPSGDVVGIRSNQPALHLDDLLVALRFAFGDRQDGFLGCSIEPSEQGMLSYVNYMNRIGGQIDRSGIDTIGRGMEQAMGEQLVKLFGAPPSSRFALAMVAADYRLKRIALAHDPSPVKKVPSYLDLAAKGLTRTSGPQPQHRWWFVGHYDAIRHTPDKQAFEFEGQGVKVQTAPASSAANGSPTGPKPSRSATLFAEAFTRHFPDLAAQVPVFNELKNLIALSVAAELIRQHGSAGQGFAGPVRGADGPLLAENKGQKAWRPGHFLDEKTCPLAAYEVPRHTASLANVRLVRDRHWMFSVSGGVEIDPAALVNPETLKPAPGEKLNGIHSGSVPPAQSNRFWWD